jgi:ankyrin repeat protein
LLARGADANAADIYGATPLLRAVQAQRVGVVRALLASARVDVNAADENGHTALHHAAAQGAPEIARLLLGAGARREARDRDGRSAVDLALGSGHREVAELLQAPRIP